MKKLHLLLVLFMASSILSAQKIGVVDTDYLLNKMPQYKEAESRLNQQINSWENEAKKLQQEFENEKSAFENEKILLVGEQLKERKKAVEDAENKVKNFINDKFGTNGEINLLRANLTKPFQDQIWNAIKKVVEKNNLGIVLDKSNNISVLFLDNKYDYTDKVNDVLNNKNTSKTKSSEKLKKY